MSDFRLKAFQIALVTGWALLTAAGLGYLFRYSSLPGELATTSSKWPEHTQILRPLKTPTLVVFLHPRCPCSRATLGELEKIVTKIHKRVSISAVFYRPLQEPIEWTDTDLWRKANSTPFVTAMIDSDGVEARRFGVETSGTSFLYDENGNLIFRGGITPARGHMGANPGEDSIQAWSEGSRILVKESKVFGCSIFSPGELRD